LKHFEPLDYDFENDNFELFLSRFNTPFLLDMEIFTTIERLFTKITPFASLEELTPGRFSVVVNGAHTRANSTSNMNRISEVGGDRLVVRRKSLYSDTILPEGASSDAFKRLVEAERSNASSLAFNHLQEIAEEKFVPPAEALRLSVKDGRKSVRTSGRNSVEDRVAATSPAEAPLAIIEVNSSVQPPFADFALEAVRVNSLSMPQIPAIAFEGDVVHEAVVVAVDGESVGQSQAAAVKEVRKSITAIGLDAPLPPIAASRKPSVVANAEEGLPPVAPSELSVTANGSEKAANAEALTLTLSRDASMNSKSESSRSETASPAAATPAAKDDESEDEFVAPYIELLEKKKRILSEARQILQLETECLDKAIQVATVFSDHKKEHAHVPLDMDPIVFQIVEHGHLKVSEVDLSSILLDLEPNTDVDISVLLERPTAIPAQKLKFSQLKMSDSRKSYKTTFVPFERKARNAAVNPFLGTGLPYSGVQIYPRNTN
jgi:hypothetical protein